MAAEQGSQLWPDIESGKLPVYWDDGKVVHACEGAMFHQINFLVWTKCGRDVPAYRAHYVRHGKYTYGTDKVTCPKCGGQS